LRRLSFLRGQLGFALLLAAAAPAMVAFCWHPVIATIGDDSVSYLVLARYFSPWNPDPLAAGWAPYFSNFPPLFPLLLAITGGAYELLVGHLVVAAGAVASLVLAHAYARERLSNEAGALAVTFLFVMLPGMWLGLMGILSESTYLALSMAALLYEAKRVGPHSRASAYVVLGLWIAAALLARTAAFALVAAYAVRMTVDGLRARRFPAPRAWLALAIPAAAQLAWLASRPALAVTAYQEWVAQLAQRWLTQPVATFAESWRDLSRGWIGDFAADAAGRRRRRLRLRPRRRGVARGRRARGNSRVGSTAGMCSRVSPCSSSGCSTKTTRAGSCFRCCRSRSCTRPRPCTPWPSACVLAPARRSRPSPSRSSP
jgi:hypothetical protein